LDLAVMSFTPSRDDVVDVVGSSAAVPKPHLKALVIGQARWTALVASGLNTFTDVEADSVAIRSFSDAIRMLSPSRFRTADVIVRVGFRPGAHTIRGRLFDAVFGMMHAGRRAPVVYYWLGTDVQNLARDARSEAGLSRFRAFSGAATHVADSDALREELAALGVPSTTAWLPAPNAPRDRAIVPMPDRFTVLSYVPDAQAAFYDGPTLLEVAKRMKHARFRFVSGSGSSTAEVPENVEFLGWREDMDRLYEESSVLVRSLEHDSVSCMAVEALAFGRPVVYSAHLPGTVHTTFGDASELESALRDIEARIERGDSLVTPETITWARNVADPTTCYQTIAEAIRRAAHA
jgi:hypothetical protein